MGIAPDRRSSERDNHPNYSGRRARVLSLNELKSGKGVAKVTPCRQNKRIGTSLLYFYHELTFKVLNHILHIVSDPTTVARQL